MNIDKDYSTLVVREKESVVTITINRPDKLNALSSEVLGELKDILQELHDDEDFSVKGVTLTGSGPKAFIAGADISKMAKMSVGEGKALGALGQEVSTLFESLQVPVIAAVNGFALGGGCEMAMSCDVILASKNAIFGQPEVKLGLIPAFGGTQRLPRYIGRPRAKELTYSGRHIDAFKAKDWGLVNEVYESAADLLEAAEDLHKEFQKNSSFAVGAAKKALNDGVDLEMNAALKIELDQFEVAFGSDDKKIGVEAFLNKAKPEFTGK